MSAGEFLSREPRLEDYWRGIVLFGRNVASYKFALAKTLLDLNAQSGQLLSCQTLLPFLLSTLPSISKLPIGRQHQPAVNFWMLAGSSTAVKLRAIASLRRPFVAALAM